MEDKYKIDFPETGELNFKNVILNTDEPYCYNGKKIRGVLLHDGCFVVNGVYFNPDQFSILEDEEEIVKPVFHKDFISLLNKSITFSKTNKQKRKIKFHYFIEWMQSINLRFNWKYENFFLLGTGNLTKETVLKMYDEYNKDKFVVGAKIAKYSGKPFPNGEKIETIVDFAINKLDPKGRKAAVFSDGNVCGLDLTYVI